MGAEGANFESVQERLNQIVDEVSAEDISLDDALKLYEEAVKLGLSACDLSEQDVDAFLATAEPEGEPEPASADELANADEPVVAAADKPEAAASVDSEPDPAAPASRDAEE